MIMLPKTAIAARSTDKIQSLTTVQIRAILQKIRIRAICQKVSQENSEIQASTMFRDSQYRGLSLCAKS